jgi:hypothetical protein
MAKEYVFIDEWDVDAPQDADWRVIADRPLLRILTPILRPVFRWNHNWSVKRAIEGLEPYARSRSGGPGTAGA